MGKRQEVSVHPDLTSELKANKATAAEGAMGMRWHRHVYYMVLNARALFLTSSVTEKTRIAATAPRLRAAGKHSASIMVHSAPSGANVQFGSRVAHHGSEPLLASRVP
eukprot:6207652-Pleurochrysis_carterae.AAC.7